MLADLLCFDSVFFLESETLGQKIGHGIRNEFFMMIFEFILLVEDAFFNQRLGVGNKVVLPEQHIMYKQPKRPYIYLRPVSLLPENFRRHKYRRAYNLLIDLFFDRKPEIAQLV